MGEEIEEIAARLDSIESAMAERPGEAQTELEAVLPELGESIRVRQADARRLLRNEDFAGAAHLLVENGLLLQRCASVVLELREQVRRRR